MDNGTMVESFKFLNYYELATSSLVSKRYGNLIRTHRHKLALLDVCSIGVNSYIANQDPSVIRMFDKELSSEEYNEMIVRNGYSKQVPLEGRIAEKESSENDSDIYKLYANVYQDPNNRLGVATTVFFADVELKDENWPKLVVWTKDHVRCDEFQIYISSDLNYDEVLLDLFLTGALCTSAIHVSYYDLSKVIVDLVQKFTGLKNFDEYQMVEIIRSNLKDRGVLEALKRNFAEFIAEEQFEEDLSTRHVIGFINNDIQKKLTLDIGNDSYGPFSIKITNT
ncbi:hypothetical protein DdX_21375 [Ditylenchus destructor]|uniref:Uncharacterized protein n=1 Tax=Ditylenchus destructor TaxID=166010 RepID=A0AAD4QVL6_9BILA|nr:hypothetical protein DdX_21375 [Ditylenchus destructor]